MRTTSADKFVDFVHNLEVLNSRANRDCSTSDTEYDERDLRSAIVVAEGDLLQPERVDNGGIVFNVVKRSSLTPASRSSDDSLHNSPVDELVQHESLDDEMDEGSSISDNDSVVVAANDAFGGE